MKRARGFLLACLSMVLLGASAALADELATLTGYLTDPNGLRVPNVTVQVTNVDTNIKYSGETNDEGLYRVSSIPSGTYRVVVQTAIEDLAGNNIGKPFEVDLFDDVQPRISNAAVSIAFVRDRRRPGGS